MQNKNPLLVDLPTLSLAPSWKFEWNCLGAVKPPAVVIQSVVGEERGKFIVESQILSQYLTVHSSGAGWGLNYPIILTSWFPSSVLPYLYEY